MNSTLDSDSDAVSLSKTRLDEVLSWPALQHAFFSLPKYDLLDVNGETQTTLLDPFSDLKNSPSPNTGRLRMSTERADVRPLVERFFSSVHTKNLILDQDSVQVCTNRYYEDGPLFDMPTCLVLIICALGAMAAPFTAEEHLYSPNSEASPHRLDRFEIAGACALLLQSG